MFEVRDSRPTWPTWCLGTLHLFSATVLWGGCYWFYKTPRTELEEMEKLDLVINQEDLKLLNIKLCYCHCTHSGRVFVVVVVYWQKIGIVVICTRCPPYVSVVGTFGELRRCGFAGRSLFLGTGFGVSKATPFLISSLNSLLVVQEVSRQL